MSPLTKVAHDHVALEHEVARVAALVSRGDVAKERLDSLRAVFLAHLDDEEQNLFPFLRRQVPGVDGDVDALLQEHAQLRCLLDDLDVADAAGIAQTRAAFASLRAAYDAHTLREADFLATLIDELAPGDVMPG